MFSRKNISKLYNKMYPYIVTTKLTKINYTTLTSFYVHLPLPHARSDIRVPNNKLPWYTPSISPSLINSIENWCNSFSTFLFNKLMKPRTVVCKHDIADVIRSVELKTPLGNESTNKKSRTGQWSPNGACHIACVWSTYCWPDFRECN